MRKISKYVAVVAYRKYEFDTKEEAVAFAMTAAQTATEPVEVAIHIISEDENVVV